MDKPQETTTHETSLQMKPASQSPHWLLRRFPHAMRAVLLVLIAVFIASIVNAINPLSLPWGTSPDGRVTIPKVFWKHLPEVDAPAAKKLLELPGYLLVDSRDAKDFKKARIPKSINVPMRDWDNVWPAARKMLPRDKTLILSCYGGRCGLSTRQGKRLLEEGYTKLIILRGGWYAWRKEHYPIEKARKTRGN